VELEVTTDAEEMCIEIHDTGGGMPESEQKVLENKRETPLQHSKGLGLWLTTWITDHSGGTLTVEASESTGTTVVMTFPR